MTAIYEMKDIKEAAEQLNKGELVAFPTETVFGLGAMANNAAAVDKVFAVKGRPTDNPLIVHISHPEEIFDYAVVDEARKALITQIIKVFWPGPLTLVVPIKPGIFPDNVTGGLQTVGIRLPNHNGTQKLIAEAGFPLVGPSANLSGKPSPTTVDHVLHDFDGKIAGVLNSEPTQIGVESTVLDLSNPEGVQILRPGFVTKEMLESQIPDLHVEYVKLSSLETDDKPKSPGMKYRHYSPKQPVIAISRDKLAAYLALHQTETIGVVASDDVLATLEQTYETYSLGDTIKTAMHYLYGALRYFDNLDDIDKIVVELYPNVAMHGAYRNRLIKASSETIE